MPVLALLAIMLLPFPLHASSMTTDERLERNLETLKGAEYYQFMDGVDRMMADGLGFSDSAFEQLNALFRALKQQDPERYAAIRKGYPGVFEHLEVE
jgi:hypothetical protein